VETIPLLSTHERAYAKGDDRISSNCLPLSPHYSGGRGGGSTSKANPITCSGAASASAGVVLLVRVHLLVAYCS
jgi:hypothetical protein